MAVSLAFVLAAALAHGDEDAGAETEETVDDIAYEVTIEGVGEESLREVMEQASQSVEFADRPPASVRGLDVRVEDDLERLQKVLRSEGYYDGRVGYRIDSSVSPVQVVFDVDPGLRYDLDTYEVRYVGPGGPGGLPTDPRELGLEIGMPAQAAAIVRAETRLIKLLGQGGYPLASVADRQVVVDHATHTMRVSVTVDQGAFARFGEVSFQGLEEVRSSYPLSLITWEKGETFDERVLAEFRTALWETQQFSTVSIAKAKQVAADGTLPLTVTVVEAAPRSVGAGGTYSTDEGFGVTLFWRHRNLFGEGESLDTSLGLAEIRQVISATFRKPVFLHQDQSFLASLAFAREDTDAFKGETGTASVGVERELDKGLKISGGLTMEYSSLEDANEDVETSYVYGVPLTLSLDRTNDRLNPEEGYKVLAQVTPSYGTGDLNGFFVSSSVTGSLYVPFDESRQVVWAARAKVGSIVGVSTEALPANLRFYAGGGGSVRGYEFQSVGPLDSDNDPVGGRSVIEIGTEVRIKVTDTIGIVPFVDAGNVFDTTWPDLSEGLLWAAGIGARYYTDIGPVRIDIATPINRRSSDDYFQIYVSLGQAF